MSLLSKFIRLSLISTVFVPLMSYSTTFVPISVGDITIIIPVDIAPEAKNDLIANIPERHVDLDVPVSVIDNDTDENPSTLTVTLVSQASSNGQPLAVSDDNQTIIYTTLPGWNGTDTFQYQVTDESGQQSNVATATVTFVDANDPPVAVTDRFIVLETDLCDVNSPTDREYRIDHCLFRLGNIFANDVDDGGSNTIQVNQILFGSRVRPGRNFFSDGLTYYQTSGENFLRVEPNGDIFYLVHPSTFNTNIDFIDYTLIDDEGLVSNLASINFQIEGDTAPILPTVTPILPVPGSFIEPSEAVEARAEANDVGGSIRRVEFSIDGGVTWESDSIEPYSHDFELVPTGDYVMQYRAVDNSGFESDVVSVPFTVGVRPNVLPQLTSSEVSPSAPYDTDSFIAANATAVDNDGLIYSIEFSLDGGDWIVDDSEPFGADFGTLSVGTHTIDYRAKDNVGDYSTVVRQTFEVTEAVNELPIIRSVSPLEGANFIESSSVIATAEAEDLDGEVLSISFRIDNGTWITDDNPPFSHEFSALSVGSHTIDYQATDDEDGDSTVVSRTIEVTETPNELPTLNVLAPTDSAVYLTSQAVEVRAEAEDNDGTIVLVEARVVGDNSWTPVLEPPYHIDLGTLAAGTHSIEIRSRDDDSAYSPIVTRSITVNIPPRRIIYIHTDALGSPAAETNEQGTSEQGGQP